MLNKVITRATSETKEYEPGDLFRACNGTMYMLVYVPDLGYTAVSLAAGRSHKEGCYDCTRDAVRELEFYRRGATITITD